MSESILRIFQNVTLIKQRSHMDRSAWNAGRIVEGSCTDVVLKFLNDHPGKSFTRSEVVDETRLSAKSVSWALHHLKQEKHIECFNFGGLRSPLYLRYRAKQ